MSNVSVADILKILGDWTESNKFIELVREKLKISDRQAYRLIKKDKQILKLVLPDRTVLYGLAEFGLPKSEVKPSKFGFFEYWHRKGRTQQRERLLIHKEDLLRAAQYCELLVKFYPEEMAAFGELAKNYREEIKELDKELGLE